MNYRRAMLAGIWLGAIAPAAGAAVAEVCLEPVATREGPVTGAAGAGGAACEYKGIPYAAPPKGELRWKAPLPPPRRQSNLAAEAFGPSCLQKESFSGGGKSKSLSEDCLTLNIFRPAKSGSFPVMFWIHGGGYTIGAGSYEMYNGSRLAAEREVVVVTINYRLGVLGFLALPELAAEDPHQSFGNYGILDSIAALEWVRDNVAGFGGDPKNVTIFGESAGGVSVCTLLAAAPAAGRFQRGIIESGGCDLARTRKTGFQAGLKLAKAAGCEGEQPLSCLRKKSGRELVAVKAAAGNHIDGYLLKDQPLAVIQAGGSNRVPLMVGTNKDEGNLFLLMIPGAPIAGRAVVTKGLKMALGPRADEVLGLYSFADYRRPFFMFAAIFTDGFGSRGFAAAEAHAPLAPVYYYRFDWDEERFGKTLGAFHGLEIPLVFGNLNLHLKQSALRLALNDKSIKSAAPLSGQMMTYWTNFAKTGDPNGSNLPAWPVYTTDKRERIYLDTAIRVAPLTDQELKRYKTFASLSMEDLSWGKDTGQTK